RPLYTQNHGAERNYPGGYRHDSVPDARTRELSWPSARVTYLSGYYASGPRERSMRIVTESTSDRLTKPDALRIQPGWQNGEDIHTMADAIRQSIVVLAPDGATLYANRAALDYTGVTAGDVNDKGFLARAFHADDVGRVREKRRIGLLEGLPFELEMRSLFKNGQYRWQLVQYNPLKDRNGRIIRWYVTATDIEDRKRMEELRLEERVNERTRIARELHDTLLQSFQGLLLRFQSASKILPSRPVEAKQRLDSALDQAAQAITEGRDAVQGLRSSVVETNDLAKAIIAMRAELTSETSATHAPTIDVEVQDTARNLSPIVRDEAYRIAGEALRNALRHAQARRITVQIRYDKRLFRLTVRDDGKGIDAKIFNAGMRAGHHGMPGMRERAKLAGGKLTFWSHPDSGTEIELTIPAPLAYVKV